MNSIFPKLVKPGFTQAIVNKYMKKTFFQTFQIPLYEPEIPTTENIEMKGRNSKVPKRVILM